MKTKKSILNLSLLIVSAIVINSCTTSTSTPNTPQVTAGSSDSASTTMPQPDSRIDSQNSAGATSATPMYNSPSSASGSAINPSIVSKIPMNEENKTKNNYFTNYGNNPFVLTQNDNKSTFSIDVDTASYTWLRKSLDNNILVNKDAVRTEEYLNFFDYNYPKPIDGKFSINTDLVNSNLNSNTKIMRIGIQGKEIDNSIRKSANLTFVVDVSGSMSQENRLELVKNSLEILVNQLNNNDRIAIVVFGSDARVVLNATGIEQKDKIIQSIKALKTEGSTNTEAGLKLGYLLAEKNFSSGEINRVILCSDGVANVGQVGPDAILSKIKQSSQSGINLSTVGFGMGNYNDTLMEKLADQGDGNYAYVDNIKEAQRIFVQNLTGTLQVIAKDTKIQFQFNPQVVKEYRLIGYEKRDIADKDFRNNNVDAGEVGSNQSVTALYELKLNDNVNYGKIGSLFLRYKDVDKGDNVIEVNKDVDLKNLTDFSNASSSTKLAISV
ncbi:MAG: von Willebrand factor type A domain-containing protein, partial [Candidatus Sericytochromatia bacterium]|nr:von Willebrand factor type A domain-containing protein [Candidatus Sericytochromatia bacterium]